MYIVQFVPFVLAFGAALASEQAPAVADGQKANFSMMITVDETTRATYWRAAR